MAEQFFNKVVDDVYLAAEQIQALMTGDLLNDNGDSGDGGGGGGELGQTSQIASLSKETMSSGNTLRSEPTMGISLLHFPHPAQRPRRK